jgi:hypothetical protein
MEENYYYENSKENTDGDWGLGIGDWSNPHFI